MDSNQFFSTPSTPLAVALHLIGVPWANANFRCAMTYRDGFLADTKAALVRVGKWDSDKPFTPQDAQRMGYVDQSTFFFQRTAKLDAAMKGWNAGCEAIRDADFRIELTAFEDEQAATLLAIALGPNGFRSRMISLMKNAIATLAVQTGEGVSFFVKDATA
jgi:hypothetical protein